MQSLRAGEYVYNDAAQSIGAQQSQREQGVKSKNIHIPMASGLRCVGGRKQHSAKKMSNNA